MAENQNEKRESTDRPAGVRVSAPRCVHCAKPVVPRYRPFCSQRCADVDLGQWLRGGYRVPTDEEPELDAEPPLPVDNSRASE